MKEYPLLQIDAFTTQRYKGNPCAVVLDSDGLAGPDMLAVAKEMNLSETAFVSRVSNGKIQARYFTPAEEIPMAGHPTIAAAFALMETDKIPLRESPIKIIFELQIGAFPVEIYHNNGKVQTIVMFQNRPQFKRKYPANQVLPIFNLAPQDIIPNLPIQTVSTGTPQLMIPLKNIEALNKAELNITTYKKLKSKGDFFSPHLFCLSGATTNGDTFARHFGVPPDTLEDPFTGSATGGMAAYLWHYRLINKASFVAEQGHWMGRPGQANVEIVGQPGKIESIKIGGSAVCVFKGTLYF